LTEAELLAIAMTSWGNALTCIDLWLTVLSGYLVTAYVAGSNMTHSQIYFVNFLFLGAALGLLSGHGAFAQTSIEAEALAFAMSTQRTEPPNGYVAWVVLVFYIIATFASLKFMYDIRCTDAGK
jgi:hypothetical protein